MYESSPQLRTQALVLCPTLQRMLSSLTKGTRALRESAELERRRCGSTPALQPPDTPALQGAGLNSRRWARKEPQKTRPGGAPRGRLVGPSALVLQKEKLRHRKTCTSDWSSSEMSCSLEHSRPRRPGPSLLGLEVPLSSTGVSMNVPWGRFRVRTLGLCL